MDIQMIVYMKIYQSAAIGINHKSYCIWPWQYVPLAPPTWYYCSDIKSQNKCNRNQITPNFTESTNIFKLTKEIIVLESFFNQIVPKSKSFHLRASAYAIFALQVERLKKSKKTLRKISLPSLFRIENESVHDTYKEIDWKISK